MEGIVKNLANADSVTDAQMMTSINRMIDWVSWPLGKNIDKWIIALLKGLAAVKKFSILTEVSLSKIQKVFSKLLYPVVREGALCVLRYLLLSFQHSPEAFHLIVPHIPQMVSCLSNESTNSAGSCLEQFAELIHCMVFRFSGYPDLYEPVMEAIKKLPVPNEDRVKQLLGQNAWTSQKSELAPYYPRLVSKSDTGKIGLINLGNTCYMNSILQALFMASDFRHSVLCLQDSSSQPLMMKLQHLFAFLEHSQRPAISPESFLASSWPPWFTPGVQQDCSEYLKYLLDRLHEEEKTGKRISQTLAQANCSVQVKKTILGNRTLVEQMFGGRIVTKIRCLKCQSISAREEAFTDLSLAFPPREDSTTTFSRTTMPSSAPGADMGPKNFEPRAQRSKGSPRKQKADKYHSKAEKSDNDQDEEENDYSEVDGKDLTASSSTESVGSKKCSLNLSDLINHFLCPEMLTEDNKYRCETCGSLQDAEKVVELSAAPQYLILTLLRFSFDLKAMRRRKILDNVSIPLILKLPIQRNPHLCIESCSRSTSVNFRQSASYDLCTVIVHSGLSSESGHYYCYSRDCTDRESPKPPSASAKKFTSEKHLDVEIQWYLFNDTRVSFSSFESVSNVTSFFPKDTAYVLFYRHQMRDRTDSKSHGDVALSKELMEAISKDNIKYLQEQEKEARNRAAYMSPLLKSPLWWQDFDKDSDDDASAGGLGSATGGASGSFLVF